MRGMRMLRVPGGLGTGGAAKWARDRQRERTGYIYRSAAFGASEGVLGWDGALLVFGVYTTQHDIGVLAGEAFWRLGHACLLRS